VGAKIGSNAVVTKDVPANMTATGIPARVIDGDKKKTTSFSPYAVNKDDNDPMAQSLQKLIEKVEAQEKEIERLSKKNKSSSTK
jgi:serine O-acetyltransferase